MSEQDEPRDENAESTEGSADRLTAVSSYKVQGAIPDAGGVGVYGYNTAQLGKGRGVYGRSNSSGTGAAGVYGRLTSNTGQVYGVHGISLSSTTDAAGVRGEATAGSGTIHGVYGRTDSPDGFGVYSADDAKVTGDLDVTGNVSTTNVSATGDVSATNVTASGDLDAGGSVFANDDLSVGGYQDVNQVGSTAWLENTTSIGAGTLTKVPFDVAGHDQRNELNLPYHQVASEGQYHVTANIEWGTEAFTSYSDEFNLYIYLDEDPVARLMGQRGRGASISKTLRGVADGQQISIRVEHFSGGSVNLKGSPPGTFMTVDKIG